MRVVTAAVLSGVWMGNSTKLDAKLGKNEGSNVLQAYIELMVGVHLENVARWLNRCHKSSITHVRGEYGGGC